METIKFVTALLTFYLKGEIAIDQNFVSFKQPNTILGLIPLGARKQKVPITQIASVDSNFKLRFLRLLLGIAATIMGFVLMSDSFLAGLIVLLIGVGLFLDAFEINLQVNMTSGQSTMIDFFLFDKKKAEMAETRINAILANRLNDTNVRQQTDRIVGAIESKQ